MPPPQQNDTDKKKAPVQETAPARKPKQASKHTTNTKVGNMFLDELDPIFIGSANRDGGRYVDGDPAEQAGKW
jgi:hypothetical protein